MDSIRHRLDFLSKELEKTKNAFYVKIGISRQTIISNIEGRSSPNFKTLKSILEVYPFISAEWLMRGIGHWKKENRQYDDQLEDRISLLEDQMRFLQKGNQKES